MEYIRGSGALECIVHNELKTLYNLHVFSPDPAVPCVAYTQASYCEIYILCYILGVCHFDFSHGREMDIISGICLIFAK